MNKRIKKKQEGLVINKLKRYTKRHFEKNYMYTYYIDRRNKMIYTYPDKKFLFRYKYTGNINNPYIMIDNR